MNKTSVILGTIALEINRWSSRVPSFKVSDWIDKIRGDGFDGLELWENHVLLAEGEANRIKESGFPVVVYNSYIGFEDAARQKRDGAAEMIRFLGASSVKYNVGAGMDLFDEYKKNVREFADMLPDNCLLLCECHAGTILEDNETAKQFFEGLPADKFGIILHPFNDASVLQERFNIFGARIKQMHSQLVNENSERVCLASAPEYVSSCMNILKGNNFTGGFTIEFTGGTSMPGENIYCLFENAKSDLNYLKL